MHTLWLTAVGACPCWPEGDHQVCMYGGVTTTCSMPECHIE